MRIHPTPPPPLNFMVQFSGPRKFECYLEDSDGKDTYDLDNKGKLVKLTRKDIREIRDGIDKHEDEFNKDLYWQTKVALKPPSEPLADINGNAIDENGYPETFAKLYEKKDRGLLW